MPSTTVASGRRATGWIEHLALMTEFVHCLSCKTPNPRASYLTHCVACGAPLAAFGSATAPGHPQGRGAALRARLARVVSVACLVYAGATCLVLVTMRLLGDRWWLGTLLLFAPRWIWALPAPALLAAALRVRRNVIWAPCLGAALTFGPIMGYHAAWPRRETASLNRPPSRPETLRVLSCNIHYSNLDAAAFTALVNRAKPHIVAIQEWSHHYKIADDGGRNGWFVKTEGELCLCSRYPIIEIDPLGYRFEGIRASAARFVVRTPSGDVDVVNVHLISARDGLSSLKGNPVNVPAAVSENLGIRWHDSEVVSRWASKKVRRSAIILGDFNLPPESAIYRRFWSEYPDTFDLGGSGYGYTWFSGWHGLRIDHILARGWRCARFWVGPDVRSDHRPIVADLVPQPES